MFYDVLSHSDGFKGGKTFSYAVVGYSGIKTTGYGEHCVEHCVFTKSGYQTVLYYSVRAYGIETHSLGGITNISGSEIGFCVFKRYIAGAVDSEKERLISVQYKLPVTSESF